MNYGVIRDLIKSEGLFLTENSATEPKNMKKLLDATLELTIAKDEIS